MSELATYDTSSTPTLRFERTLAHPIDAVWRAITELDQLEHWFPSTITGRVRPGERLAFEFKDHDIPQMHGQVTEYEEPRRLSIASPASSIHRTASRRAASPPTSGRATTRPTSAGDSRPTRR
jgi:uncharacterized protein YndB with AHSA1/START domain